jgi:hypothetical protein
MQGVYKNRVPRSRLQLVNGHFIDLTCGFIVVAFAIALYMRSCFPVEPI